MISITDSEFLMIKRIIEKELTRNPEWFYWNKDDGYSRDLPISWSSDILDSLPIDEINGSDPLNPRKKTVSCRLLACIKKNRTGFNIPFRQKIFSKSILIKLPETTSNFARICLMNRFEP